MTSRQRAIENFREHLRKIMNNQQDIMQMDGMSLARNVDADVIAKTRLSVYGRQSESVKRLTHKADYYENSQKYKDLKDVGAPLSPRDFELEDNVAQIYFETYGTGFYGEPYPSKDENWVCPHCGLKHYMSVKTMARTCRKCGWLTPIGELDRDGVMRR